ncbi:MAG TPA: hypothetical protein VH815_16085 [Acidobacteriota bacterium]
MKQKLNLFVLAILALAILVPLLQAQMNSNQPPRALVGVYQIAPGKHLEFLKWQAANEAINKEAGLPATQFYAHTDGASWDYISIGPVLTDEQQNKVDEISKKKGVATGFKASLQFREFVSSHTDTFVIGPVSAADLVQAGQ